MTSSPDTSDFQDIAIWTGPSLTPVGGLNIPVAGLATAVFWTGSFASLELQAGSTTHPYTFNVLYYYDSGGIDFIGQYTFTVVPGVTLGVALPNLGPYVQFDFTNLSSSVAGTFFLATPSNIACQQVTFLTTDNVVNPGSVSYGAGTTTSYLLPFIGGGLGHIHLSSPTVSGVLVAKLALTVDGVTAGNQIYGHAYTGFVDDLMWFPDVPLLAQVQNTDTVARSAVLYVNVGT